MSKAGREKMWLFLKFLLVSDGAEGLGNVANINVPYPREKDTKGLKF